MRKSIALGLVTALVLWGSAWAGNAPHDPAPPTIEGTWAVSLTYYYDGTTAGPSDNLQYLQQFDRHGRSVIYLPQASGQRFDESRTACAGEWKRRDHRTYDVTLYCIWSEIWAEAPDVPDRILIKVKMARDGRGWTATPFYYQRFVDGEYGGAPGWGDMKGTRQGVVAIP